MVEMFWIHPGFGCEILRLEMRYRPESIMKGEAQSWRSCKSFKTKNVLQCRCNWLERETMEGLMNTEDIPCGRKSTDIQVGELVRPHSRNSTRNQSWWEHNTWSNFPNVITHIGYLEEYLPCGIADGIPLSSIVLFIVGFKEILTQWESSSMVP